jgi:YD repeat-containing protein
VKTYKPTYNNQLEGNLKITVGKTYTHSLEPDPYRFGFSSYLTLDSLFERHKYSDNLVIYELENLGTIIEEDGMITCNQIKVSRELPKEEWDNCEFNEDGQLAYIRHTYTSIISDNEEKVEEWFEYDERGNQIHTKSTSGYENWVKYDDQNRVIYIRTKNESDYPSDEEYWAEYDEQGHEIYVKYPNGFEEWKEYNEDGEQIGYKDNEGSEWKITIE